jgi:glycosyltransferase involved in cell wall biosynthesis
MQELFPAREFSGPLLWWGQSLCCGGLERQLVTMGEFFAKKSIPPVLACANLSKEKGNAFFLPQARKCFKAIHDLSGFTSAEKEHVDNARRMMEFFRDAPPRFLNSTLKYLIFFLQFRPCLVQIWNADFLHVPMAAALAGVPHVIIAGRSVSPRAGLAWNLERVNDVFARGVLTFLLRFPSVIMTNNCRAGAGDYADWLGIDPGRICITPNAFVDANPGMADIGTVRTFRESLGIPETAFVVGGLFRLEKTKDPLLWIKTAELVLQGNPDAYAVLGGDGPMRPELNDMVRDSPVGNRLALPGLIRDTRTFYKACACLLLTSHIEGLPNVALEAQYNGLPVVSTLAGGVEEAVAHGETGFIVAGRSPAALAERIFHISRHPDWAQAAAKKGPARVISHFSLERAGNILLRLYRHLPAVVRTCGDVFL